MSSLNGDEDAEHGSRFQQLETTLEEWQENACTLGQTTAEFRTQQDQWTINQNVHTIVAGLTGLRQLCHQMGDVHVLCELLDYVDKDKNPELYTHAVLERTERKSPTGTYANRTTMTTA